ncbi:hypothetical protein [Streptomyces sp. NPDC058745]|uniref:hypothetical protein n=1 Tax=Streptomyces sp. NPDC058745 TaxID=3346621 RepID=UPI0036C8EDCC
MVAHSVAPIPLGNATAVLQYALIPVHGYGIAMATAARMLDGEAEGTQARFLATGEPIPYGAQPVLLAESTLYGAMCVEEMLRSWGSLPKPWLVLIADAPARPVTDARYIVRALEGRLAGVARVPYLPVLRAVKGPWEALQHKDVQAAAAKLRRTLEGR